MSFSVVRGKIQKSFQKDRILVGSSPSVDYQIDDPSLAAIHAVLEKVSPGKYRVFLLAEQKRPLQEGKSGVSIDVGNGETFVLGDLEFSLAAAQEKIVSPVSASSETSFSSSQFETIHEDRNAPPILLEGQMGSSIEVISVFDDLILDVKHFPTTSKVSVGSNKSADFLIASQAGRKTFNLVEGMGATAKMNVKPGEMRGFIQQGGRVKPLSEWKEEIHLEQSDFAQVEVGAQKFFVRFSDAPPVIDKKIRSRDPLLKRVLSVSLVLSLLLMLLLWNFPVPEVATTKLDTLSPETLTLILRSPIDESKRPKTQIQENGERFREFEQKRVDAQKLYKIDFEKNIPKPGGANTSAQSQAEEGVGQKARGQEGERGSLTAEKNPQKQNTASRPSPEKGKGRGGSKSQVEGPGNLDLVKDASLRLQKLLGSSTRRLGKGGSDAKGYGDIDSFGKGGQALAGNNTGGGGTRDFLGGLSNQGDSGGRVGTGKGAAGRGKGMVGGQSKVELRQGTGEDASIIGSIDADAYERAMLAHRDEFRLCYEREINAEKPKLSGRVSTEFTVGAKGRTVDARVASTTLNEENVERCLINVINRIQFPVAPGGGLVQIRWPFKFTVTSEK